MSDSLGWLLLMTGQEIVRLEQEAAALEARLNRNSFRADFDKCKCALALLYYDSSYRSRSKHVNEYLNDPEIQRWIKENA